MLNYKKLDKELDNILESFTKEDLQNWLKEKTEKENLEIYEKIHQIALEKINTLVQEEWLKTNKFHADCIVSVLPDGSKYKDGKKLNEERVADLRTEWELKQKYESKD